MDIEYLKRSAAPQLQKYYPKTINLDFSGSSPPELFVGEYGYPHVYTGILAPTTHDEEAEQLTNPETWFEKKMTINDILFLRSSLIYSRFKIDVKTKEHKLLDTMQEISMAEKPTAVEFHLKKQPHMSMTFDSKHPPIGNAAPLIKARLEENPHVPTAVEKVVSDTDFKAAPAINQLYEKNISVTHIMKLLSAGLLGMKPQRKLTPSKWSITAVDSLLSKQHLTDIRTYNLINDYQVFHDEYLGNHYEILLIPKAWSYEVLEHTLPSPTYPTGGWWTDHEGHWNRTIYASSVVGAYYANRLAVTEYLQKIQRQASIMIFREVKPEYWAPCGVGILRETTRNAFKQPKETFTTLKEAFQSIQTRLKVPISSYLAHSKLYTTIKEQKSLLEY
ncbi:MAG: hypothetical protein Q7R96_06590 [Nanoarchaeota archaeon]|nr:hypothetical protein [Nanoarchaeota archaeon]